MIHDGLEASLESSPERARVCERVRTRVCVRGDLSIQSNNAFAQYNQSQRACITRDLSTTSPGLDRSRDFGGLSYQVVAPQLRGDADGGVLIGVLLGRGG